MPQRNIGLKLDIEATIRAAHAEEEQFYTKSQTLLSNLVPNNGGGGSAANNNAASHGAGNAHHHLLMRSHSPSASPPPPQMLFGGISGTYQGMRGGPSALTSQLNSHSNNHASLAPVIMMPPPTLHSTYNSPPPSPRSHSHFGSRPIFAKPSPTLQQQQQHLFVGGGGMIDNDSFIPLGRLASSPSHSYTTASHADAGRGGVMGAAGVGNNAVSGGGVGTGGGAFLPSGDALESSANTATTNTNTIGGNNNTPSIRTATTTYGGVRSEGITTETNASMGMLGGTHDGGTMIGSGSGGAGGGTLLVSPTFGHSQLSPPMSTLEAVGYGMEDPSSVYHPQHLQQCYTTAHNSNSNNGGGGVGGVGANYHHSGGGYGSSDGFNSSGANNNTTGSFGSQGYLSRNGGFDRIFYLDDGEPAFVELGLIGKGAGGSVKKAQHRLTGEMFAIKEIKCHNVQQLDQTKREIQSLFGVGRLSGGRKHHHNKADALVPAVGYTDDDCTATGTNTTATTTTTTSSSSNATGPQTQMGDVGLGTAFTAAAVAVPPSVATEPTTSSIKACEGNKRDDDEDCDDAGVEEESGIDVSTTTTGGTLTMLTSVTTAENLMTSSAMHRVAHNRSITPETSIYGATSSYGGVGGAGYCAALSPMPGSSSQSHTAFPAMMVGGISMSGTAATVHLSGRTHTMTGCGGGGMSPSCQSTTELSSPSRLVLDSVSAATPMTAMTPPLYPPLQAPPIGNTQCAFASPPASRHDIPTSSSAAAPLVRADNDDMAGAVDGGGVLVGCSKASYQQQCSHNTSASTANTDSPAKTAFLPITAGSDTPNTHPRHVDPHEDLSNLPPINGPATTTKALFPMGAVSPLAPPSYQQLQQHHTLGVVVDNYQRFLELQRCALPSLSSATVSVGIDSHSQHTPAALGLVFSPVGTSPTSACLAATILATTTTAATIADDTDVKQRSRSPAPTIAFANQSTATATSTTTISTTGGGCAQLQMQQPLATAHETSTLTQDDATTNTTKSSYTQVYLGSRDAFDAVVGMALATMPIGTVAGVNSADSDDDEARGCNEEGSGGKRPSALGYHQGIGDDGTTSSNGGAVDPFRPVAAVGGIQLATHTAEACGRMATSGVGCGGSTIVAMAVGLDEHRPSLGTASLLNDGAMASDGTTSYVGVGLLNLGDSTATSLAAITTAPGSHAHLLGAVIQTTHGSESFMGGPHRNSSIGSAMALASRLTPHQTGLPTPNNFNFHHRQLESSDRGASNRTIITSAGSRNNASAMGDEYNNASAGTHHNNRSSGGATTPGGEGYHHASAVYVGNNGSSMGAIGDDHNLPPAAVSSSNVSSSQQHHTNQGPHNNNNNNNASSIGTSAGSRVSSLMGCDDGSSPRLRIHRHTNSQHPSSQFLDSTSLVSAGSPIISRPPLGAAKTNHQQAPLSPSPTAVAGPSANQPLHHPGLNNGTSSSDRCSFSAAATSSGGPPTSSSDNAADVGGMLGLGRPTTRPGVPTLRIQTCTSPLPPLPSLGSPGLSIKPPLSPTGAYHVTSGGRFQLRTMPIVPPKAQTCFSNSTNVGSEVASALTSPAYPVVNDGKPPAAKQTGATTTETNDDTQPPLALNPLFAACPNIVKSYGVAVHDQSVLVAMELLDGSLDYVRRRARGCVPEPILASFAYDILTGLEYLHTERRIVHRDIKPPNILFSCESGVAKIADFGICTSVGGGEVATTPKNRRGAGGVGGFGGPSSPSNHDRNSFVGTVSYMSPERLLGRTYSVSCDVWSVGITLLELAIGIHPFQHHFVQARLQRLQTLPQRTLQAMQLHSTNTNNSSNPLGFVGGGGTNSTSLTTVTSVLSPPLQHANSPSCGYTSISPAQGTTTTATNGAVATRSMLISPTIVASSPPNTGDSTTSNSNHQNASAADSSVGGVFGSVNSPPNATMTARRTTSARELSTSRVSYVSTTTTASHLSVEAKFWVLLKLLTSAEPLDVHDLMTKGRDVIGRVVANTVGTVSDVGGSCTATTAALHHNAATRKLLRARGANGGGLISAGVSMIGAAPSAIAGLNLFDSGATTTSGALPLYLPSGHQTPRAIVGVNGGTGGGLGGAGGGPLDSCGSFAHVRGQFSDSEPQRVGGHGRPSEDEDAFGNPSVIVGGGSTAGGHTRFMCENGGNDDDGQPNSRSTDGVFSLGGPLTNPSAATGGAHADGDDDAPVHGLDIGCFPNTAGNRGHHHNARTFSQSTTTTTTVGGNTMLLLKGGTAADAFGTTAPSTDRTTVGELSRRGDIPDDSSSVGVDANTANHHPPIGSNSNEKGPEEDASEGGGCAAPSSAEVNTSKSESIAAANDTTSTVIIVYNNNNSSISSKISPSSTAPLRSAATMSQQHQQQTLSSAKDVTPTTTTTTDTNLLLLTTSPTPPPPYCGNGRPEVKSMAADPFPSPMKRNKNSTPERLRGCDKGGRGELVCEDNDDDANEDDSSSDTEEIRVVEGHDDDEASAQSVLLINASANVGHHRLPLIHLQHTTEPVVTSGGGESRSSAAESSSHHPYSNSTSSNANTAAPPRASPHTTNATATASRRDSSGDDDGSEVPFLLGAAETAIALFAASSNTARYLAEDGGLTVGATAAGGATTLLTPSLIAAGGSAHIPSNTNNAAAAMSINNCSRTIDFDVHAASDILTMAKVHPIPYMDGGSVCVSVSVSTTGRGGGAASSTTTGEPTTTTATATNTAHTAGTHSSHSSDASLIPHHRHHRYPPNNSSSAALSRATDTTTSGSQRSILTTTASSSGNRSHSSAATAPGGAGIITDGPNSSIHNTSSTTAMGHTGLLSTTSGSVITTTGMLSQTVMGSGSFSTAAARHLHGVGTTAISTSSLGHAPPAYYQHHVPMASQLALQPPPLSSSAAVSPSTAHALSSYPSPSTARYCVVGDGATPTIVGRGSMNTSGAGGGGLPTPPLPAHIAAAVDVGALRLSGPPATTTSAANNATASVGTVLLGDNPMVDSFFGEDTVPRSILGLGGSPPVTGGGSRSEGVGLVLGVGGGVVAEGGGGSLPFRPATCTNGGGGGSVFTVLSDRSSMVSANTVASSASAQDTNTGISNGGGDSGGSPIGTVVSSRRTTSSDESAVASALIAGHVGGSGVTLGNAVGGVSENCNASEHQPARGLNEDDDNTNRIDDHQLSSRQEQQQGGTTISTSAVATQSSSALLTSGGIGAMSEGTQTNYTTQSSSVLLLPTAVDTPAAGTPPAGVLVIPSNPAAESRGGGGISGSVVPSATTMMSSAGFGRTATTFSATAAAAVMLTPEPAISDTINFGSETSNGGGVLAGVTLHPHQGTSSPIGLPPLSLHAGHSLPFPTTVAVGGAGGIDSSSSNPRMYRGGGFFDGDDNIDDDDDLEPESSPDYVDFIERCLEKDPRQRPTAATLLTHPFLQRRATYAEVSSFLKELRREEAEELTTNNNSTSIAGVSGSGPISSTGGGGGGGNNTTSPSTTATATANNSLQNSHNPTPAPAGRGAGTNTSLNATFMTAVPSGGHALGGGTTAATAITSPAATQL